MESRIRSYGSTPRSFIVGNPKRRTPSDPGMIANEIGGNGAGPEGVTSANCSGIVRSVTETFCPVAVMACRAPSENGTRNCTPGNIRSIISTIGNDKLVK